jgi:hypothetical protein
MRTLQRLNHNNSRLALSLIFLNLVFLTLVFGLLLGLPGCSVNVKKDSDGKDKNVDIGTPRH